MMTSLRRAARSTVALGAVLALALTASACSDRETPTNPTGIASVIGLWRGTYRVRACVDTVSGAPGTLCTTLVDTTPPLQLSLQQSDDRVVGSLQFTGWIVRSVVVTGVVQEGASVVLTGTTTTQDPTCPALQHRFTLTFWTSTVNRARDTMTGDLKFTGTVRAPTGCVFDEFAIEADTLTLTKQ